MATLDIADGDLRDPLMHFYLGLSAYPDAPETLRRLKERGMKPAILSNGSPTMWASAVRNAGLDQVFDAVLSVDEVDVFKPHPSVYQLAIARFNAVLEKICFLSSNGWDAFSAKAFGFRVLWCNRFGQVPERIPTVPDGEVANLSGLPELFDICKN